MDPYERRMYNQKMAELLYQTYYEVRLKHGFKDTKPWSRIKGDAKNVWFEVAQRMMSAADVAGDEPTNKNII